MLEAFNLTRHLAAKAGDTSSLLDNVCFSAPVSQVTLIVGSPGSGKRSLLHALAAIRPADQGAITLHGRDLSRHPLHPNEFALVNPASTGSLPADLTAREVISNALLLRVAALSRDDLASRTSRFLGLCGLETVAASRVASLSPVQLRRLLLASSLVSDPTLLLCQDFTQDIDAKSERELVALLKLVASDVPGRVVINLTASLSQLPAYDTIIVLHEGRVCFHGPARAIPHYFTIKSVEDLYPRLAMRPAARWGDSWTRHRDSYYSAFKIGATPESLATATDETSEASPDRIRLPASNPGDPASTPDSESPPSSVAPSPPALPGTLAQTRLLLSRRWTLLRRNRHEWRVLALLFFVLPLFAVLLIWPNKGFLDAMLHAAKAATLPADKLWPAAYTCLMAPFVQILLVLCFAARCSTRELAGERAVIDREQLGGVRPGAVLLSKIGFLFPLVIGQALWLGLFVEMLTGGLPGPLWLRLALPVGTALAFSSLCLAISAHASSPERAHSHGLSLAFAQVLLAGALLGLPRVLGGVIQPFITAYYGWSGIIQGMDAHPVHQAMGTLVRTGFASPSLALGALALHTLAGLLIARLGLRRPRSA